MFIFHVMEGRVRGVRCFLSRYSEWSCEQERITGLVAEQKEQKCMLAASGSVLRLLCPTHSLSDLSSLSAFSTACVYPNNSACLSQAQPSMQSTSTSLLVFLRNTSCPKLSFSPLLRSPSQQQLYPSGCSESSLSLLFSHTPQLNRNHFNSLLKNIS